MMKIGQNKWWLGVLALICFPVLTSLIKDGESGNQHFDNSNWAEAKLSSMTLKQKIGQFFMIAAYPEKGDAHIAELKQVISDNNIGGVIFFQGTSTSLRKSILELNQSTALPLLYGMDAEWGASMRLTDRPRFPYAYTIGAADNLELTTQLGEMMAQECRELGIHLSFGPVADVNSNPNNPVIGFRSFGENPEKVGNHVAAMVKAYQSNGVMTSIKHFPGHGDTDSDSHVELPIVNRSFSEIDAIDGFPFREGIRAEAASVMVGHLNVPALDPSGTPSSLSSKVIKGYLQGELGFKGLVISDALNMKAVADKYGKTQVVVKAFMAGCDILLFPESIQEAISAIETKVIKGEITESEINTRCLKVLKAKEKFVVNPGIFKKYTEGEREAATYKTMEKATVLLKNNKSLPFNDLTGKTLHIIVGENGEIFKDLIDRYDDVKHVNLTEGFDPLVLQDKELSRVIITVHASSVRPKNEFGIPSELKTLLPILPKNISATLVIFGNPLALRNGYDLSNIDALIAGYENNQFVQDRVAQMIYGGLPITGKLPFSISPEIHREFGMETTSNGRLSFVLPEELGISPKKLLEIDSIVQLGIEAKAFPGCQVVAAYKGQVFYRKSFGTKKYDDDRIKDSDLYDIASITKIAASTMSIMKLQSEGSFSLDKQLGDYLPELTTGTRYASIILRDMLAHRAGLKSWIPFYTKTLVNGQLNNEIYSTESKPGFTTKVEDHLYIRDDYTDTMYQRILSTSLGSRKYVYSDLGYYFIKKIVEGKTNQTMDAYLDNEVYAKMGLPTMRYNPYKSMPMDRLIPTEQDNIYRKKLIQGYVHDPGAAMIGGVGGHAGLFSNATDLAAMMQLFLNEGEYGGVRFIQPEVLREYTKVQFQGNRRGAGFDKPKTSGGGTCDELASQSSYGHSGFTGTLAWADPVNHINFVFLSNRVYPDAENWKLVKMGTRTEIQHVIYEAVNNRRK